VNPYVSVGLVMCLISIIALAATSYMAVFFNRRAKADLAAALEPLTVVVDGSANIEEAVVTGRYNVHIAEGRVAQMPGGMGRVFNASVVDGAGGEKWTWTISRSKEPGGPSSYDFEGPDERLEAQLQGPVHDLAADNTLADAWFKIDYDPAAGTIRLTRPMKTRRDIPEAEPFRRYLTSLVQIADANRAVQYHETSSPGSAVT
jgi:hypothetical protein